MDEDKVLTHEEFSRRGGEKTLETRGKDFLGEIAKKGGEATKAKADPEYYKRIQRLSVEARKKNKESLPATKEVVNVEGEEVELTIKEKPVPFWKKYIK